MRINIDDKPKSAGSSDKAHLAGIIISKIASIENDLRLLKEYEDKNWQFATNRAQRAVNIDNLIPSFKEQAREYLQDEIDALWKELAKVSAAPDRAWPEGGPS